MIEKKIREFLLVYMKNRDKARITICRFMLSEFKNSKIALKTKELSIAEEMQILRKIAKQKKETISFCQRTSSPDLEEEKIMLQTIEAFLPELFSDEKLLQILKERISTSDKEENIGSLMKHLRDKYLGYYDAQRASLLARKLLEEK